MTPPTLAEVAELIELERKATPGPWRAYGQWVAEVTAHAVGDPEAPDTRILAGNEFDCDLAAALHNAAPALLAAAKRLAELESALEYTGRKYRPAHDRVWEYSIDGLFEFAKRLGWTPPSEAK